MSMLPARQLARLFGPPLLLAMGCAGVAGCAHTATPPTPLNLYIQGVHQYQAGDTDQAVATLQRATQESDRLVMARSLLGDLYRSRGQYERAAAVYEQLVQLDPDTADNFYHLGVSYQFINRLRDAARAYQKALKLDPADTKARANLGLTYLSLGEVDDAITNLRQATQADPKNADAWTKLAVALQVKGDYAGAESAYRKSLDLNPDQPRVLLDLASTLVAARRTEEATALLDTFLSTHPADADAAYARKIYGDALTADGRDDSAVLQYDQALALAPRYAAALAGKGDALIADYRRGLELDDAKRQAALTAWRASLEIDPSQPQVQAAVKRWESNSL